MLVHFPLLILLKFPFIGVYRKAFHVLFFCRLLSYYNKPMAITGDLENLHIADIIQLIHTTRQSGTFTVTGDKGESRIIFSNGYIVSASHLNNKIRIGNVLVKMKAITIEDLEEAIKTQRDAGAERKPLITTLLKMGKLGYEDASKALKKLIEITIVELISWTKGNFTFDADAIEVSEECNYIPGTMDQELGVDAQMVLMDALRVFDERERDRQAGKDVLSEEELFAEAVPSELTVEREKKSSVFLTADDLGLAEVEKLERKIPQPVSVEEIFNTSEIHRHTIRDILSDFSTLDQEAFISFLGKAALSVGDYNAFTRNKERANAIILFSGDQIIKHAVMTICKSDDTLVFATAEEEELDRIIAQCLSIKSLPVLVFDTPWKSDKGFSEEKIISLRQKIRKKYPNISVLQFVSSIDNDFALGSLHEGVMAVLPKPQKEVAKKNFIAETIKFLETFKSYIKSFMQVQNKLSATDNHVKKLKDQVEIFRRLNELAEISEAFLKSVSEMFERTVTFFVRPPDLIWEKAIGVNRGKNAGPASASRFKIPLTDSSVFKDVIEREKIFYGESNDEILKKHLFAEIGAPLRSTIILIPVKSRGKIITLTYGDFGQKEVLPVQIDSLEILAHHAGLILENALYSKQLQKVPQN